MSLPVFTPVLVLWRWRRWSFLPVQLPFPPSTSVQLRPPGSSFDKICAQRSSPVCAQKKYDTVTYDGLHRLCGRRGYAKKDSTAAHKTRLDASDALDRQRARDAQDGSPVGDGRRNRVDDIHLASASDEESAKERAQWWNPSSGDQQGATKYSPLGGVEAAMTAWAAEQCVTPSGRELSAKSGREHAALVRAAKPRELGER